MIGLLEFTGNPSLAEGGGKRDVNWSQTGVRNNTINKSKNLIPSFHTWQMNRFMPVIGFKTARSGNQKYTSWGEVVEDFFLDELQSLFA